MRILLFTGKGGVGKTTAAAATAVRLAESGRRVLVLSTDPAHSLGDAFGLRLRNEPTPVTERLDAAEIDTLAENDRAWARLRAYLGRVVARMDTDSIANDEMLLLPGLGELFSLLRILDHADADAYDVLVVDCAPTGESLALLTYPEKLGTALERVLPMKRAAARVLRGPVEKLTSVPMPEDRLFDDVTTLVDRLTRLGDLLRDDARVSVRLVTTPERIVIAEARRAYTWLTMYGFTVDAVVLNRLFPDAALTGYFAPWAQAHAAGVRLVHASFGHLPVFTLELQPAEVGGLDGLRAVAALLYPEGVDPADVFYRGRFATVVKTDAGHELHLRLPYADKADLTLTQDGGDLVLSYRNEQRRFALPDSLAGGEVTRARSVEDGLVLSVTRSGG